MTKPRPLWAWAAERIAFACVIWFGVVVGVEGAARLAMFYLWVVALSSLSLFADDARTRFREAALLAPAWRRSAGWVINWAALLSLVWHGWTGTAVAYAVAMSLSHWAISTTPKNETPKEAA